MLSAFGIVALVLAALGIYGVLTYAVSQRTSEIGLRVALGARSGDVVRMVTGQGMALVAVGIALGLVVAGIGGRFVGGMLYAVEPFDFATIAAVAGLLGVVAFIACLVPAVRAGRVDPL